MQRCRLIPALIPALMLMLAFEAQAGVYKCRGPDGRLSFSSQPCPAQQQIDHRLSADEKQRQADAAASRDRQQQEAQGPGDAATPQNAYDRLMQKLAGRVYRQGAPLTGPGTAAQPESNADQLAGELVRTMEQGLTFNVEPGSTFDPVSNNPGDASVQQVAAFLKTNLHNPGSLELIEWGPVLKVIKIDKLDFSSRKEYRVRLRFQAKNGLGRYVPLDQVFILDTSATVKRVADFDGRPLQDY
ncbi:DUF4124 domain-containing protein [Marinobacterium sedimentorum]|uniref:DUF4124 domain-containing protein n=1 Tax=Marinobacterium sedimentorum TaxID=2927804 RepID=UPI0020C5C268|nr:DUF4124 domain-containing protein [Marinobacterium sedimentorum]MCP8689435.1 DUF4124 domain-containing protein [Marinobacterium sedimentorum]